MMVNINECKRISIIGPSGSGKSTLAVRLGEILNLPVHHIDCIWHKPNGVTVGKETLAEIVKQITQTKEWITEGVYRRTLENRFMQSDVIIMLNFSKEFCTESVKNRHKNPVRLGLPDYFVETDEGLELLISYHINEKYPDTYEREIKPLIEKHKNKVLEFTTREQVDEFTAQLQKQK